MSFSPLLPHFSPYHYLPEAFVNHIETHFYGQVSKQSVLEEVYDDPHFLKDPIKHVALYTDHGIVHVRDVAHQIILVLDTINGVLIPNRNRSTLDFMQGYGVAVAYLHDIGMRDFSPDGRFMHPEFAAQMVFSKEFAPLIEELWESNAGNIAWRLLNLHQQHLLEQDPRQVLREMLALSMCHSKSKVPISLLNDPSALQQHLRYCVGTDLAYLSANQHVSRAKRKLQNAQERGIPEAIAKWTAQLTRAQEALKNFGSHSTEAGYKNQAAWALYLDFSQEAFSWLSSAEPQIKRLVWDVIDTLRALRCADALRQRGTVLRTSAGYEIFVDQLSGHAIFALRSQDNRRLFLLEGKKPLNAGEANIASSEVDKGGNLRVSFHRGSFATAEATQRAARNAAVAIYDIQADVLQSFIGVTHIAEEALLHVPKDIETVQILLEGTDDNPTFTPMVLAELEQLDPDLSKRSKLVASLQQAALNEVQRYLQGEDLSRHFPISQLSAQLTQHADQIGVQLKEQDLDNALQEVKLIHLQPGDVLIESGSSSGFVYIPLGEGLTVIPLGGYSPVPSKAWVPIGNTGVIRGSERNAKVIAKGEVALIAIPKQVYLTYWYKKYSQDELAKALVEFNPQEEKSAKT